MQKTKISYLTHTWNPIRMRCAPVSAGCDNCWHLDICHRFKINEGDFGLRDKELEAPLSHKKPCVIGVQFMGDLFHKSVPFEWIDKVYSVMLHGHQHTWQVLTKRPERMYEYYRYKTHVAKEADNIWLGVTAENQEMADKRIPILLDIPASKRFVSCEPLLGSIHIEPYLLSEYDKASHDHQMIRPLSAYRRDNKLSWVIVGAESGHNRRTCYVEWIDELASQCEAWGTPCFVKQMFVNGKKIVCPAQYPQEFPKGA